MALHRSRSLVPVSLASQCHVHRDLDGLPPLDTGLVKHLPPGAAGAVGPHVEKGRRDFISGPVRDTFRARIGTASGTRFFFVSARLDPTGCLSTVYTPVTMIRARDKL
jgi:hypothetical protein